MSSNKQNRSVIFNSFLICFSLYFLIFLYGPTQIYINNALDFTFNITDIWNYMLPLSLISAIIGTLILTFFFRMSRKAGLLLEIICTGLLLAFFIEGNYLAVRLPLLDGSEINWNEYNGNRILSCIVWCMCILASILCFFKIKKERSLKVIKWINTILLLFMAITLLISCTTERNILTDKSNASLTADGMMMMSQEKNFVIFLLDSIDARTFQKVLNDDTNYKEVFRDFTFFTNTLCMYPFTDRSVPYILFGKWNDNSKYFSDYLEESIKESPFFDQLLKNGFDQRVYYDSLQGLSIAKQKFGNFVTAEKLKNPVLFCKMLVKLSGFRYFPYYLKRFCVLTPENIYIDSLKTTADDSLDLYSYSNADLYERIKENDIIIKNSSCFRFIYAWGAHAPYIYDKNLNEIQDATYEEAIESSIRLVDMYLEKLKNSGVFDNTVIVVMADHGINTANYLGREGRQNPFMLIKGFGEKHEYIENDAPISHADLQTAFLHLLEGKSANEAFEWKEGDIRTRVYMLSDSGVMTKMIEYETSGHASDVGSLYPTERVLLYTGEP